MATSREEVDAMIKAALLAFEQRVGLHMVEKAKEMVTIEQARTSLDDTMGRIREEFKLSETRFTELIVKNIATFEEHKTALLKVVADLESAGVSGPRIATALDGTKELSQKNEETRAVLEALATELRGQIESTKASSTVEIESIKREASTWADKFKSDLFGLMESTKGMGKGGGKDEERRSPAIDRKETAVWKLPVGVTKLEFRHWIDTIETNFDAAMGFKYPEVVLDKVKRSEVPITESNWKLILAVANENIPSNRAIDKEIEERKKKGGSEGFSGGLDPWTSKMDIADHWQFEEKSRFLWNFLLGRLNAELYSKTLSIENRNGFELYRQVVRAVDEIPENAKFLMGPRSRILFTSSVIRSKTSRPSTSSAFWSLIELQHSRRPLART